MRILSRDSELVAAGADAYELATSYWWFERTDGQYDYAKVSIAAIDDASKSSNADIPLLVDIEAFDPWHDTDKLIANVRLALMRARTNFPKRQIGLYGILPVREYWGIIGSHEYLQIGNYEKWIARRNRVQEWKKLHDHIAVELLDFVDFLCPSIYALYPGQEGKYKQYAAANIDEAERLSLGLPVYPALMGAYASGEHIEKTKWEMMVRLCVEHPGSDGMIIHTSSSWEYADNWREPIVQALEPQPSANE